jgi:hypothetical protein
MTVDIRCNVYCRFGPIVEGRISDRKVDGSWLITTRGAIVIDRVFNPKRGRLVDLAYRRGSRLAEFPRLLTVLRATPDPHLGVTVLEVGDPLELLADRRERVIERAGADPLEPRKAPRPVAASAILQTCLSRLGLTLSEQSEPLTGRYLQESYDLSEGYVTVLRKLIESHSCYAYVTKGGRLRIEKLRMNQPEPGPLFTWQDLAKIERIQGAAMPPDVIEVAYNGREAPRAAGDGWYPIVSDGLGSVDDWTDRLSSLETSDDGAGYGFGGPGSPNSPIDTPYPEPDEDSFKFWEFDRVAGSPANIKIRYTSQTGEDMVAEYTYQPLSESRTLYKTYSIGDYSSGSLRRVEYVKERATATNTTWAAANGSYVKWALENGEEVPSGVLWNYSITTYEYYGAPVHVSAGYNFGPDGPTQTVETIREYVSGVQLAGSLGISDYTGVTVSSATILLSETITSTWNSPNGGGSKTMTIRNMAWGATQEGNQAAASAVESGSPAAVQAVINDMATIISDGIEVRTSTSGASSRPLPDGSVPTTLLGDRPMKGGWQSPQSRPAVQELLADSIDPRDQKTIRKRFSLGGDDLAGIWSSPVGDSEDAVSLRVQMPLSPDDWFSGLGGGATLLRRGGATRAAQDYGDAVMQLKVGAAWGLSIMGDPWRLPRRPMKPIYITFNGSTNCYRMDGMSWSFNSNGMAVGADTLLSGTVGEAEG